MKLVHHSAPVGARVVLVRLERGLEQGRVLGLKVAAAKLLAAGIGRDEVERILDVKLDSLGV